MSVHRYVTVLAKMRQKHLGIRVPTTTVCMVGAKPVRIIFSSNATRSHVPHYLMEFPRVGPYTYATNFLLFNSNPFGRPLGELCAAEVYFEEVP